MRSRIQMSTKLGIEFMIGERIDQLYKHGISVKDDVEHNSEGQLKSAAVALIMTDEFKETVAQNIIDALCPKNWSMDRWKHLMNKPYPERLIIAGTLLSAEYDRLKALEASS